MRFSILINCVLIGPFVLTDEVHGDLPDNFLAEPSFERPKEGPGPKVKLIATFESVNPFSGGEVVGAHASEGRKAPARGTRVCEPRTTAGLGGV